MFQTHPLQRDIHKRRAVRPLGTGIVPGDYQAHRWSRIHHRWARITAAANSPGTAQSWREGCRHRASPNRGTFHLGRPLTRATRCLTSPWDEMRHGLGRKGLPPLHGRRPTSAQFREVEPRRGPQTRWPRTTDKSRSHRTGNPAMRYRRRTHAKLRAGAERLLRTSVIHRSQAQAACEIHAQSGPAKAALDEERRYVLGPPNEGPEGKFSDLNMLVQYAAL